MIIDQISLYQPVIFAANMKRWSSRSGNLIYLIFNSTVLNVLPPVGVCY